MGQMKEKSRQLWKTYGKSLIAVFSILLVAVGIVFIYANLESREKPAEVVYDTVTENIYMPEEAQSSMDPPAVVTELPAVTEVPVSKGENSSKEETKVTPTEAVSKAENKSKVKEDEEKEDTTKEDNKTVDGQPEVKKQPAEFTKKPKAEPTKIPPSVTPVQEKKYVPISEGWKDFKSVRGNITSEQKNDLDDMIESWMNGDISDTEVKEKIMRYLEEQGIEYMEVSVTSKGYSLYDKIPEIDLRDGGNLYSFVGTYSTGKQNPDGTASTVFYNWSAFVFEKEIN